MNAIKHTELTKARLAMTLGAALVAGAMSANVQAGDVDFSEFSRQARANVWNEATAQPDSAERINQLRGALEGARVIAGLPSPEAQAEQALAAIRAEQLRELNGRASAQMAGSLASVRVVAGLTSPAQQTEQAVAAIRAEQLDDMRRQAPGQIATSMQAATVMTSVADATPDRGRKLGEWSMPEVEFKPLIDMSILHFSFKK